MKRPSIFAFASNDVLRPQLGCIYYDPELEAAICSDGKIMVLDRYEFIPDYSGQVRDKNNEWRENFRYPNAGQLFKEYMTKEEKKTYNIDPQKTIKELNEGIKSGKRIFRERYGRKRHSNYIYYRFLDEENDRCYFFDADKLKLALSYTEADSVDIIISSKWDKTLHAKGTMCDALIRSSNFANDHSQELMEIAKNIFIHTN